ncbi:MAG: hypothetical protein MJ075_03505 [Oscillospiraceae bacterium]|nr:hypothetical protein [Oscillospiraceae bacterium]
MVTYVDEEKFFDWYKKNAKEPDSNHTRVLNQLYSKYCETGKSYFTLKASQSVSGQEVQFPFRFEDIGCGGASTLFIYF